MLSAEGLIEAIQRRMLSVAPHRRRPAGEFPPGWQGWLASVQGREGVVTGATAQSWVEIFLRRPLATPPGRVLLLNRWQAFSTLWRQQWLPPEREERSLRWFAGVVAVLWQLFLLLLLLLLLLLSLLAGAIIVDIPDGGAAALPWRHGSDQGQEEQGYRVHCSRRRYGRQFQHPYEQGGQGRVGQV